MIVIRQNQLDSLQKAGLIEFENEMMAHSKEFSPRLTELLGDEQLRIAVRQAMDRSASYGFTYRGPIRLYIELMFLCGSDFDTDPQYVNIGRILRSSEDQMVRAEQIHQGSLEYHENVAGTGNVNVHNALEALVEFSKVPLTFDESELEASMLKELHRAFSQRANFVGDAGLRALISEGVIKAQEFQLPTLRGKCLLVSLMFAFGHGCLSDPLYPWISRTLLDEKIIDGAAREQRLEKKSLTWLRHVIARNRNGAST